MLDYLDYLTFDSGPGQIMLKARMFFETREQNNRPAQRSLPGKVNRLIEMLEDGERRLMRNRRAVLKRLRNSAAHYEGDRHIVTPETQASLHLL